ncbi:unnamed protein product [Fraxinus pennsylvanica]|uniref:Transcriptional adapter 2-alpha/beta-like domain-containing protein n=1 Tax=Fraxinus pennsylvanica TaxID=56036 RepID=A0AAD2A5U7_9LAMI|nr:unnamed protein product [Fraxinus pennsylvanica]
MIFSINTFRIEDSYKNGPSSRLPSISNTGTTCSKKASNMVQVKEQPDSLKLDDHLSGRSFGSKKPKSAEDEGPSLLELSGYNLKRQEFEIEYDNDVEQLLADMEFKETDTQEERELKLRVLRIYSKRLDERKRRKDFILERNLLYPSPFEEQLSQEEKDLCRQYDVYMCFHSKEEHEELLNTVVSEHRILKRIHELKEKQLCREIRLPAPHYLRMLEFMTIQMMSGNINQKSHAYSFFQIEPTKIDRVYDMLLEKGMVQQ